MPEIICGTEFHCQYFKAICMQQYKKKFVIWNIQKSDAKLLYKKQLQKNGN